MMNRSKRIAGLGLTMLGALLLGGCGLFGGAKNTRPPTALKPIKTSLEVKHLWTASIGNGNGGYFLHLHPYIDGAHLYAADQAGRVVAFDSKSGRRQWSIKTGDKLVSGISGGGGMLFVGTQNGRVLGISIKQHGVIWQAQLSSEVMALSRPSQGEIVVHTNDGKLYALDTTTGNVLWAHGTQAPNLILRGKAQPLITSGTVIAGFADGRLAAYSLDTGAQLWQVTVAQPTGASELQRLVDVDGHLALSPSGNTVYAASYNGRVVAVQTSNGQLLWSHRMSSYAGLALGPKTVFVTDGSSDIWALDRNSGASLWRQSALHFREATAPSVVGNYVVVGDYAGYLQWMSASNGALIARERVDSAGIQARPVVVGHTVYVQGAGGQLAAYRVVGTVSKGHSGGLGGSASSQTGGFPF